MEKASPMAAALVADRPESTAALPMAKPSNNCGPRQAAAGRAQTGAARLPLCACKSLQACSGRMQPCAAQQAEPCMQCRAGISTGASLFTRLPAALVVTPPTHLVQRQGDQQGGKRGAARHAQCDANHEGVEDDARFSHVQADDLGR